MRRFDELRDKLSIETKDKNLSMVWWQSTLIMDIFFKKGWDSCAAEYEKLLAEKDAKLAKAVEALEFYASKYNWDSYLGVKDHIDDDDIDLVEYFVDGVDCSDDCGGKRARAALKEIEGE